MNLCDQHWQLDGFFFSVPIRNRHRCLHSSSFFTSSPIFMCRGRTSNLVWRTAGGDDICWALTAIPFKVAVEKS